MFWTFDLSFDILATVLATFPNIRQIFAQFSGHSVYDTLSPDQLGQVVRLGGGIRFVKATVALARVFTVIV